MRTDPENVAESGIGDSIGGETGCAGGGMPTISVFFGIVVRMYYEDHGIPHFHAYYGGDDAVIALETLDVLADGPPQPAFALVLEWALEHRPELREDWALAMAHLPLRPIPPLQ